MALSREGYQRAKAILEDVVSIQGKTFLPGFIIKSSEDEWKTGYLILDNPHNGGYEAVWTNIVNPTQEQIDKFNERKGEIGNSSIQERKGDVVCFGWF